MTKLSESQALLGAVPPSKSRWRGYYELTRLHKPIMGNTLMFWPCAWGLTMAAYLNGTPLPTLVYQISLFAVASTLLHSAACVLNDICDIDFDKQVERCRSRPLPSGVVSVSEAWTLLVLLLLPIIGMTVLTNRIATILTLFGIFPLHALYPLMKRWTYWPQAWLGLAMNWGYVVAWYAISDSSSPLSKSTIGTIVSFFLGTVCWTIVYDTIYACQDRSDDVHAGVKSTALLFGAYVRPILIVFTLLFLLLLLLAGTLNGQGVGYFVVSCAGSAAHFGWQFWSWEVERPEDGGRKFQANGWTGLLIWVGMVVDYWLRHGGALASA
ncbi:UbiA prenyltransferase family [Irpex rosettiformis]|uniref:UbiA prenyltransferase family n=1 Tax=Irpex rosettiformis TaxID=378272 RepID=A0ACB8TPX2_9APHY|nr:UbiA prenyltransferase family [Irpex rosettiformis]